jgi:hypothetical protein
MIEKKTRLQEATASEMKLHDDDPDHFEFALKFTYTLEYDTAPIEEKTGKDQNLKTMKSIIGIYTVADKYEIQRLIAPAGDYLSKIFTMQSHHEVLEAVIRAYYAVCTHPGQAIGNAMATLVLRKHSLLANIANF